MMFRLYQKAMSVNIAWKGKRFTSDAYSQFKLLFGILLSTMKTKPPRPPDAPLFAHYRWGMSNMRGDVDNPCKPFQDVLFDHWGIKDQDHKVEFLILEKMKAQKGEEFIDFHVADKSELIEYLETDSHRIERRVMSNLFKSIKFSILVAKEMRIRTFGQEHGLDPRTATTVKMILNRILKVHDIPELRDMLATQGGTTLDFIETAVAEALHNRRK